jgi:hypothetical protein
MNVSTFSNICCDIFLFFISFQEKTFLQIFLFFLSTTLKRVEET